MAPFWSCVPVGVVTKIVCRRGPLARRARAVMRFCRCKAWERSACDRVEGGRRRGKLLRRLKRANQ
eukprot:5707208-Prymnesium_polylepis.2